MKSKILLKALLPAVIISLVSTSAQASLIASEAFWTSPAPETYTNGSLASSDSPQGPVNAGNFGFSTEDVWVNSSGFFRSSNALDYSHTALTPTDGRDGNTHYVGMVKVRGWEAAGARNSTRALADPLPASDSYYLSGLVTYWGTMDDGDFMAAGMGANLGTAIIHNIGFGFHFGLSKSDGGVFLSAFAGDQIFTLAPETSGTTYQVVLRLDVNARGQETLSGWYAADGASELTKGFTAQVETWGGAEDLSNLVVQMNSATTQVADEVHLDEIRFGTSLASVTTLPKP